MSSIILRQSKGSELTFDELDANFSSLNSTKAEKSEVDLKAPASAATAAGTSNAPAGNIEATTVQAAINELDSEKAPLANPVFSGNVGIGGVPTQFGAGTTTTTVIGSSLARIEAKSSTHSAFFQCDANGQAYVGGGAGASLLLYANNVEKLRATATGNLISQVGIEIVTPNLLGYGTGAGGTVIQATSKSTAVTLNKPTGKITTHGSALAAGASAVFQVINSLVSANDGAIPTLGGAIDGAAYNAWCTGFGTGSFYVVLKNISTSSRSDEVVIDFKILKGATA